MKKNVGANNSKQKNKVNSSYPKPEKFWEKIYKQVVEYNFPKKYDV